MKRKSPSGKTGMHGKSMSLMQGSRKSPKAVDASMGIGKARVDQDAVRGMTAATPRTLGPRDA